MELLDHSGLSSEPLLHMRHRIDYESFFSRGESGRRLATMKHKAIVISGSIVLGVTNKENNTVGDFIVLLCCSICT